MATIQIDLDLVRQKLEARRGGAHEDFSVHVDGEGISFEHASARWSPRPYEGDDDIAELIATGILYNAWLSHSQYLATLFGARMVGAPLP